MNKLNSMIGLCVKAGKATFGSEQCVPQIRSGRARLVILAADASDRTKKLITNKCESFEVQCITYSTVTELAQMTGRSKVSVLAVCDKGLSAAILKIYGGGFIG